MAYVIVQLSDTHVGGPNAGSGERLSMAIDQINAMTAPADLVVLTGDLTHNGTPDEWDELRDRLAALCVPWEAIRGNHDRGIAELAGHRAIDAGPLRLVLIDSSNDTFTADDASWLDDELAGHVRPTVVAVHHPPFETGIWWMDCLGLAGKELLEAVVRRHLHVLAVLSGHVHRPISTNWASCALWVSPSTAMSIAADLDPHHDPAETAEPPAYSLHVYTGTAIVSHLVPVGPAATRFPIGAKAPEFVKSVREIQQGRDSLFA